MKKSNTLFNVLFAGLFTVSGILSVLNLTKIAKQPPDVVVNQQTVKIVEKPINYNSQMRNTIGPSVVKILGTKGGGSGFHVKSPSGKTYIITNAHVCNLHTNYILKVKAKGKRLVNKHIIEIYDNHDLCLIEGIEGTQAVEVSDKILVGESTYLVGHPSLKPLIISQGTFIYKTVLTFYTCGKYPVKYTALARSLNLFQDLTDLTCMERRTANNITNYSKPGASGSPIVNVKGKLVGILFAGDMLDHNDSYAVPLKDIKEFLKVY